MHNINSVFVQWTFVFMDYGEDLCIYNDVCIFLPLRFFFFTRHCYVLTL